VAVDNRAVTFGAETIVDLTFESATIFTVTIIPGSGDTVNIFTTTSGNPNASSATWIAWPSGAVTATTRDVHVGPILGLKATRTAGATDSVIEVAYA
jgi:hypothetical protein